LRKGRELIEIVLPGNFDLLVSKPTSFASLLIEISVLTAIRRLSLAILSINFLFSQGVRLAVSRLYSKGGASSRGRYIHRKAVSGIEAAARELHA